MAKSVQDILRDASPLPQIPDPSREEQAFGMIIHPRERAKNRFTPVMNQVIFQQIAPPAWTQSGRLLLPQQSRDQYYTPECVVISVGPDCKEIKEGDIVLLRGGRYGHVVHQKDQLMYCVEADVLCKVGNVNDGAYGNKDENQEKQ